MVVSSSPRGLGRTRSRNRILCSLALKSDIRWHQIYSDSAFASDSALLTIVRVYKLYYLLTYLQKAKMAHLGLGPYRFQSNNLRRCWMYRPAANINTASSKFQAMYHERKYLKIFVALRRSENISTSIARKSQRSVDTLCTSHS